ncbi:hypothetical protein [Metakosakonia massiliensis]|uniref:Uncharacterized protein n=1 Tax=Phytobacter massiliensis TaxID=1485952 RepID=A0A6N2ZMJ9_9ENTR|nr:hypothetical protein [Phytobacter massiliensis]
MSKNDKDKLVDTVMGEAVLSLLDSDDDVSFDALIGQLQVSLSAETNGERQEAYRTAISGVHNFRAQPEQRKGAASRLQMTQRKSRMRYSAFASSSKEVKH